jgi:DNA polymerase phi
VYAFKRLCRGLGSSRQGARQGFSLAIAALLAGTSAVGPAEAVAVVEGLLEPAGKVGRCLPGS